ncbi:cytochrome-c oxidase, cbb3-type subunit III [Aestuariispira insulae]|uniref:Cbb3-type cytochrome c oxidase subunit n=1 Tax=Aestuariispira insulae TaxID=1461337 RepID=A0A3D9HNE4_9PROT|nr:cytochrome-c oxidase, cbb3-type subunit III [Aestuariispira insulae]RED51014.1 cytochrome c oxidase cbb3-type subunit 3 [Aestuariispira insulae]
MAEDKKIDPIAGVETTGHSWDGIQELDNPMPRWWLWVFYATIAFSVVYMVMYPSVPLGKTYFKGTENYEQRVDVANDIAAAKAANSEILGKIAAADLETILADKDLRDFSRAGGKAVFLDNCAGCHGSGATGGPGYPNLADDDWIWGGDLAAINETINHGIRWDLDDDTRLSEMPNFGADEILESSDINNVSEYVLSLSGQEHDATAATNGAVVFEEQCVACHGEGGVGDQGVGAPALADAIWLHGDGSKEFLTKQLTNARHGQMPAWDDRLDETTIKMLTIYVHTLGGGQ